MRREEQEEISRIGSRVSFPAITGYFISVDVPEVAVGEDIEATIDFYAINPGALYWATYLVMDSPGLERKLLDKAREIGQEGGRRKTYTLGKMPNKDIWVSFFLFAHDDAARDWSWSEYEWWMEGYPVEITHLDSRYTFLSPGVPPPEELDFDLTKPTPSETPVLPGAPITLTCPVTSRCAVAVDAHIKVIIYEGSIWPGHGDKIAEYESATFYIESNQTKNVTISHTAVAGTIDRRDVEVEVYVDAELIKQSEWDDVYYVTEAPPEYLGKIVSKELEIMGDRKYPIPVTAEIPQDSEGKVHVLVRNTGYVGYHPGCIWEVRDPSGELFSLYSHRAFEMISPGEEHPFFEAIETFTLHEVGEYTIQIWLQDEANNTLDYWSGKLCTVRAEAPPPPLCTPGETKCIGPDLYECSPAKEWVMIEENAPECVEVEKKFPWLPVALIGGGAIAVAAAAAKKPKKPKA